MGMGMEGEFMLTWVPRFYFFVLFFFSAPSQTHTLRSHGSILSETTFFGELGRFWWTLDLVTMRPACIWLCGGGFSNIIYPNSVFATSSERETGGGV